eukprot:CAMPEP_0194227304 /NCGR_PEP_ID=MMETSP0156-20130528/42790_1 /TAXON_ID=33649 /ORGANISM="Thalassionema nitzschioides, Strain L26-B" /LENGTH=2008 /DNA_ID=CAMNT_0038959783 /DNA_START=685 /DNA_END=6711 /DNA_ORIENTATION=-
MGVAHAATRNCPVVGSEPVILPQNTTQRIFYSMGARLCLISKIRGDQAIPVARSYESNGWYPTAGGVDQQVRIIKQLASRNRADIYLPPIDEGESYQLTSHDHSERSVPLSGRDLASRFLEQATFGPIADEINYFLDGNSEVNALSFPLWVKDQINNQEPTSHRDTFRKNTATQINKNYRPGLKLHPCKENSIWRNYAIGAMDRFEYIELSGEGPYTISIHGQARTTIDTIELEDGNQLTSGSFQVCKHTQARLNGKLELKVAGNCQKVLGGNPRIYFPSSDEPALVIDLPVENKNDFTPLNNIIGEPGDFFQNAIELTNQLCDAISEGDFSQVFVNFTNGEWLVNDSRLTVKNNTLDNPLSDGGGKAVLKSGVAQCSNVPKTFFNSKSCKVSNELSACGTYQFQESGSFVLDSNAVLDLYDITKKYVYAIAGLRPDVSPCVRGVISRWELIDDALCENDLDYRTNLRLKQKIQSSSNTNSFLKDVNVKGGCDIPNTTPDPTVLDDGVKIKIDDGECWQHVHKDHLSVYDMTYWTKIDTHPGNKVAADQGKPNPIKKFAKSGEAFLVYPDWHPMSRWEDHKNMFAKIGLLGDNVAFKDLPSYMRLESVAEHFGIIGTSPSGEGVLVCGSPNEVANDLSLGRELSYSLAKNENDKDTSQLTRQKKQVWATIVLKAKDQLRQKLAWALSQILALTPRQIDSVYETEPYLSFYDIFVRNAFGSYLDILREVSYSPMMSEMLTFLQSKSTAYVWETEGSHVFADENYAREIMQLFSVGTHLLNMDGTPKLDPETNLQIETYSNAEIESLARAWTGFDRQRMRGNIEDYYGINRLDPMKIIADWRDLFPKINLYSGYIGDGVELCSDHHQQEFLKKDAKYRLLGSSTSPEMQKEFAFDQEQSSTIQLVLDATSSMLYNELCSPVDEECTFPAEVTILNDLICTSAECNIDSVRIVKVGQMFYEYMRRPCVNLLFYNNAKTMHSQQNNAMCGDPRMRHASEACCNENLIASRKCQYLGERMTYDDATVRCQEYQQSLCTPNRVDTSSSDECHQDSEDYYWTTEPCRLNIKIDGEGKVAVVHLPDGQYNVPSHVQQQDTLNFFRVTWPNNGDSFPSPSNNCGGGACEIIDDQCLCGTLEQESRLFAKGKHVNRVSVQDLLEKFLHIGAKDPASFGPDVYLPPITLANGVLVHMKNETNPGYNTETVFEVSYHGETRFFRNMKSSVNILSTSGGVTPWSFRNPPHFMSLSRPETRDAFYETEEVLKHYAHHPNTAPFVAVRLIQRFGISNPSPPYVEAVANAFTNGIYKWSNNNDESDSAITIGSSKYGNLAATSAAILLHSEARSPLLELDPSFGSLKEPIVKVIGFMRSMEYASSSETSSSRQIVPLRGVMDKIGQMAHDIPSVFSFFLSEYSPSGPITSSSLVSPEAMVYTAPNVIGLLNGLFSLVKWGLSDCEYGFGPDKDGTRRCHRYSEGVWTKSWGRTTFESSVVDPSDSHAVIDELATLLTAGRLSQERKDIIASAYAAKSSSSDVTAGLRLAQQLILTCPEFHSTNLVHLSGEERIVPDFSAKSKESETADVVDDVSSDNYKAVIYLLLHGGCDSFSLLVPHSQCSNDMYEQYASIRGELALNQTDLLIIDDHSSSQICTKFGLHPEVSSLRDLYTAGDALFFANAGHTYKDFANKYERPSKDSMHSFAHNLQRTRVQRVDPFEEVLGTGVLGRMADVASRRHDYFVHSFSIQDSAVALQNTLGYSKKQVTVASNGEVKPFNPRPSTPDMWNIIQGLNGAAIADSTSGLFGEEWSSTLLQSVKENDDLRDALANSHTTITFPDTDIGGRFEVLSRLIQSHGDRGVDRDVFSIVQGGYDTHSNNMDSIAVRFRELNAALKAFSEEMVEQSLWDQVVLVSASDFGRTLTPNSKHGTDHAWGGNYFAVGGSLNGTRILGEYPHDLTANGPLNIGRGRLIPTTSWDSIWHGVAEWFIDDDDTTESDLDAVLPNRNEFAHELLYKEDLFELL